MNEGNQRLRDFGARMRTLRANAGFLTGKDFAQRLDWQQSKVSRIENGKQAPTDSDVNTWFEATETSESEASELRDELRAIRIEMAAWPRQLTKGHRDRQVRAGQVEQRSSIIRAFDLMLLPGLVQTADYARDVLTSHATLHGLDTDVGAAVRARMDRQKVLFDTAKRIEILFLESTLLYSYSAPEVMLAQIDRLLALPVTSSVRFRILPLLSRLDVIPMHGIWIFDDSVIIETNDSEIVSEDPGDLELYNKILDSLWPAGVEGAHAREILMAASQRWATLNG
ncbi:XRE family transcriptional regulator [Kutzneria sp. CA-103260]|nr:XRE family transcriptional regulator [Kutzneria sp. CA-103260]